MYGLIRVRGVLKGFMCRAFTGGGLGNAVALTHAELSENGGTDAPP